MSRRHSIEILLFDDDKRFLEDQAELLSNKGFRCCCESDPDQAMRLVQSNPNRFGVAILDILLDNNPDRKVGLDLLRAISPHSTGVKVIMCSVTSNINDALAPISEGAYAFLRKGQFRTEEFLRVVENAVDAAYWERQHRIDRQRLSAIQTTLLPQTDRAVGPYRILSKAAPATHHEVSGDFYKVVDGNPSTRDRVGIVLGDVMGHGMASAFIAGMAFASFDIEDMLAVDLEETVTACDRRIRHLIGGTDYFSFVAACYCLFAADGRSLRYGILGQTCPIFHYRKKEERCYALNERLGPPLGLDEPYTIGELTSVSMNVGDLVVLCTDGIADFDNAPADSTKGVCEAIEELSRDGHAAGICDRLLYFSDTEDDKTIIVVEAIGESL